MKIGPSLPMDDWIFAELVNGDLVAFQLATVKCISVRKDRRVTLHFDHGPMVLKKRWPEDPGSGSFVDVRAFLTGDAADS